MFLKRFNCLVFYFLCQTCPAFSSQRPELLTALLTERAMGVLSQVLKAYREGQQEEANYHLNEIEDLYQPHLLELPQLNVDPLLLARGLVNKDTPALRAFSRVMQQGRLPPAYRVLLKIQEVREIALASQLNQQAKSILIQLPKNNKKTGCVFFWNGKPLENNKFYAFEGEWIPYGGQCPGEKPITGGFVANRDVSSPLIPVKKIETSDLEKKYASFEPFQDQETEPIVLGYGLKTSFISVTNEEDTTFVSGSFKDGLVFVVGPALQLNGISCGGEAGWVGLSRKGKHLKGLGWLFHTYVGYELWRLPFPTGVGGLDAQIHGIWATPPIQLVGASALTPGGSVGVFSRWSLGEKGLWSPYARIGFGFWLTSKKRDPQWAIHLNLGTLSFSSY